MFLLHLILASLLLQLVSARVNPPFLHCFLVLTSGRRPLSHLKTSVPNKPHHRNKLLPSLQWSQHPPHSNIPPPRLIQRPRNPRHRLPSPSREPIPPNHQHRHRRSLHHHPCRREPPLHPSRVKTHHHRTINEYGYGDSDVRHYARVDLYQGTVFAEARLGRRSGDSR